MRVRVLRAAVLVAALAFMATGANAGVVYAHDDGSGESSLGAGGGIKVIWLNAFTAVAGGNTIESIDIAFGHNGNEDPPPNGTTAIAYLWSDPNDDGNPLDAVLEATVAGTVQSSHTDTFINFALASPVTIGVGEVFFVGFQSIDFAVSRDTNSDAGQSWLFTDFGLADLDPTNLAGITGSADTFGNLGFPGNALIRANGVPEPASVLLLGAGLGFGVYRRRRRR